MSTIEITKPFRFAVEGIDVRDIQPGTYEVGEGTACTDDTVSKRCAEVAAEMGCCADPDAEPAGKPAKAAKGGKPGKDDDLLSGAGKAGAGAGEGDGGKAGTTPAGAAG